MSSDPTRLVVRASNGDVTAIRELLEKHLPQIQAVVRKRMSRVLRAHEESLDIVQSVCRQVLAGEHLFEGQREEDFRRQLLAAVERKVIDHYRHLGRERRDVGREQPLSSSGAAGQAASNGEGPSTLAARSDEERRVREALDQLEPLEREALQLSHFEGLSFPLIAERLGITLRQARWSVYKAKYRLTRLLGDSGKTSD